MGFTRFDSLVKSRQHSDFFVVQVGANDGIRDDDIRPFIEEYRWGGVLVEPLSDVFERLVDNYRGLGRELRFVNAAVSHEEGEVRFFRHPTLSVCSGLGVKTSLQRRAAMIPVTVRAVTLRSLLASRIGEAVDLLQIDTEGFDGEIVMMLPDDLPRPRIIRYEHKHFTMDHRAEVESFLRDRGYELFWERNDTVAYQPT